MCRRVACNDSAAMRRPTEETASVVPQGRYADLSMGGERRDFAAAHL